MFDIYTYNRKIQLSSPVESSTRSYNTDRIDRTIKGFSRLSYKILAKEAVQVLWCLVLVLSLVPGL